MIWPTPSRSQWYHSGIPVCPEEWCGLCIDIHPLHSHRGDVCLWVYGIKGCAKIQQHQNRSLCSVQRQVDITSDLEQCCFGAVSSSVSTPMLVEEVVSIQMVYHLTSHHFLQAFSNESDVWYRAIIFLKSSSGSNPRLFSRGRMTASFTLDGTTPVDGDFFTAAVSTDRTTWNTQGSFRSHVGIASNMHDFVCDFMMILPKLSSEMMENSMSSLFRDWRMTGSPYPGVVEQQRQC